MGDSNTIKELLIKIEVEKELLEAMPKKSEKSIEKYIQAINELLEKYKEYNNEITEILNERYEKEIDIKPSKEIENLDSRINTISNVLYLLSEEKNSYEKMGLDKIIYKVAKYYKENFETTNAQIAECMKQFNKVGIRIELSDFDYSSYAKQYMEVFFKALEKSDINSEELKTKFEEIYWKCPEIIMHIELNLRSIYLKNKPIIDRYFEKEKASLLKRWDKTPKEIMELYMDLKRQRREKILQDKKYLLDDFLTGKLNIKDYYEDKINANYTKVLSKKILNEEIDSEELEKNILKFLNSLYEYKNYMNFKFVIDDMKIYYKEKEKYKKVYAETKKKIELKEKRLRELNRKNTSKSLFFKKLKDNKIMLEHSELILELKELYKELDLNEFYNKMSEILTDTSTIYDALKLANSYYNYLTKCVIKVNRSIEHENIEGKTEKLTELLDNPNNTIINNITILEEKDVGMIVSDRYTLLDFNVEKEDITPENVDTLITTLECIERNLCLKRAGLEIDKIEEILELKKILKK